VSTRSQTPHEKPCIDPTEEQVDEAQHEDELGYGRLLFTIGRSPATLLRGTARFAPQDREFVPRFDDFEFLEFLRPDAQTMNWRSQPSKT
jgi:hypothetical protein